MRRCFFVLRSLIFFLWIFTGLDFFPFLSGDNQVSKGKSSHMADTLFREGFAGMDV